MADQRNRIPLAELPVVPGASPPTNTDDTFPTTPPRRIALAIRLIDSPGRNRIPDGMLTPISPEDMAIPRRSQRRTAVVNWSPIRDSVPTPSSMRTPPRNTSTMMLRSTPKKRSLTQDFANVSATSDGLSPPTAHTSSDDSPGTSAKKPRVDDAVGIRQNAAIELKTILKGYGKDQLISIIDSIVTKNKLSEDAIRRELPLPDIKALESELRRIKSNIYASVPDSVLQSRTNSYGYSYAVTHLKSFLHTIHSHANNLNTSQQWEALFDYVLMAWPHVHDMLVYENPRHNATRQKCFQLLARQAASALKHGALRPGSDRIKLFEQMLPRMVKDSVEIEKCRKYLVE